MSAACGVEGVSRSIESVPLSFEPDLRRPRWTSASANLVCSAVRTVGRARRLHEERNDEIQARVRSLVEVIRQQREAVSARIVESEQRAADMTAYADDVERRASKAEEWIQRVTAEIAGRSSSGRPAV